MTRQEYDKAKHECKENLRNKLMHGNLQDDLFSATFDRAYALGKQQKTIAQEDIEKAAEAFATPPIGNGGMFTRQQVKELLVRFAQLLLSKQEKDAEATEALALQWRSVEEELPEDDRLVLAHFSDVYPKLSYATAYYRDGAWQIPDDWYYDCKIDFWKPIPPIPETNTEKK